MRVSENGYGSFVITVCGTGGPHPRISLPVGSHGGIQSPELELSERDLHSLFRTMLPYIKGAKLNGSNWDRSFLQAAFKELIRVFREICESGDTKDEDNGGQRRSDLIGGHPPLLSQEQKAIRAFLETLNATEETDVSAATQ